MALVSMQTDDSVEYRDGGMCLYLNDDQCEALGLTEPLKAGSKVMITAAAYVVSATESVEDDGDDTGTDVSLTLQITDLELNPSSGNAASLLYGG